MLQINSRTPPASVGTAVEPIGEMALDKVERDMLVAAMAGDATATNILLGVTHRLVARNALSWEDVQDIYDLALTTFKRVPVQLIP